MNKLSRPINEKLTYLGLSLLFLFLLLKNIYSNYFEIKVFLYSLFSLLFFMAFIFSLRLPQIEIKNGVIVLHSNLLMGGVTVEVKDIKNISILPNHKGVLLELVKGELEFKPYWPSNKNINYIHKFLIELCDVV